MRGYESGCYRRFGLLCAMCAVLAVGCNHRTPPQPSRTVGETGKLPGQVETPPDKVDKCRPEGKIITCVEGICDPATGDCVECLSASDCKTLENPVCGDKKCMPCDAAHDCHNGKCDVNTGRCVECLADADCVLRERGVCWQGICSACDATNCTQTCDAITGKCGTPAPLPCPGGNCGVPSPVTVIDPATLAMGNNIRLVSVAVRDRTANEKPTEIGSYRVDARVNGMYAVVSTEFTVFNPNGRVFEGELEFPLPDDAVVSGYAIDVNGAMVDGRVVEKEKARIAFEEEVKLGVDPGLVEQVKGNAYRTRIYPIPARGTRRIRVDYTTPLTIAPNGDAALALPMPRTKLAQRDISISVASGMPAPAVGGLGDKRFESAEAVWRVESHDTDITPTENVLVAMPNLPDVVTGVEHDGGDIFFAASVKVGSDAQPQAVPAVPSRWRIVWDASGSRAPADVAAARKLIDSLPETASYELHVFRNALEPVQTFDSRAALVAVLDTLAYDGGTDFEPLKAIAAAKFDGPTLFFTDGMDTMTNALPEFGASSVAVLSGAARDVSSMRRICGGRTLNLDITNGNDALRQILAPQPVISAVNGAGLSDIQGIGLPASGRVTVLGRLQTPGAQTSIVLSDGRQIPVSFASTAIPSGKTLATAWATRRVDELSPRADDNREELLALGRHFSIVSPVSSMIVFERLDQWVKYDIEPPETLADMHAQWMRRHKTEGQKQAEELRRQEQWNADLTREWNARVAWWNAPVPEPPKPKIGVWNDDVEAEEEASDDFAADAAPQMRQAESVELWAPSDAMNAAGGGYGLGMSGAGGGGAGLGGFGAGGGGRAAAAKSKSASSARESSRPRHAGASIKVKAWDPDTPYLKAIKDAYLVYKTPDSLYAEYLKQREKYSESPAFFLDCAGLFFKENQHKLAVRILSNLSELKIDDVGMLRIYAWRLREAGDYDTALIILRKVAKIRADEAISWRDLALTLTMRGKQNMNAADIQEALECFHKTVFKAWPRSDAMWSSIIALEEFNELAAWTRRQTWSGEAPRIPDIDAKFSQNLDTDLRIMMTWDADETDIDMHVLEPSGEEIYYAHNRSRTGGLVSHDVTRGYGPEEFLHKIAPKGTYSVFTKYFASHQQRLVGPATITLTFYTNWGRPTQKSETVSLRLDKAKDKVIVGSINVE
ncbi:MAG: DUF2135 domain-containing protein [Proteobacteria bacterium]|nr:DUF2135 domain-containing protein [Pseudomonadota bacterium]